MLITSRSVEMLCLREDTFDLVEENDNWRIFKNANKSTAILFDPDDLSPFKERLKETDGLISVYVFSLTNDTYSEAFTGTGKQNNAVRCT